MNTTKQSPPPDPRACSDRAGADRLASQIDDAASAVVCDFAAEHLRVSLGALTARGLAVAGWAAQRTVPPLAMLLSNTSSCAAVLLGCLTAGIPVVSLPLPRGNEAGDQYLRFLRTAVRSTGADTVLLDSALAVMAGDQLGVDIVSYETVLGSNTGPGGADWPGFALTQFTSGSTSEPTAVRLTAAQLLANIDAVLSVLGPNGSESVCSWLPLSHDMGLIGMFFGACLGAGPGRAARVTLTLLRPEDFLRAPSSWLTLCSERGATITAAPDFAYAYTARRVSPVGLDLSSLRIAITGAERVSVETLTAFTDRFTPAGFRDRAFSPAYGMAEVGVAASLTPPSERWHHTVRAGMTAVSCGPPLPHYAVTVDSTGADHGIGELLIAGPSVHDAGPDEVRVDGLMHTGDVGFVDAGEVFVLGRSDEVISVRGRKLYPQDIEAAAGSVVGVRSGRVAAVGDGDAGFRVILEAADDHDLGASRALAIAVRGAVNNATGAVASQVHIVPRGSLPLTASGKLRRHALATMAQRPEFPSLPGSLV